MKLTPAMRAIWAVIGVTLGVALAIASAVNALIFLLAYGSPLGSYAGQAGDRHLAWRLLISLIILWVVVLGSMLWPALRWKRRGMFTAQSSSGE